MSAPFSSPLTRLASRLSAWMGIGPDPPEAAVGGAAVVEARLRAAALADVALQRQLAEREIEIVDQQLTLARSVARRTEFTLREVLVACEHDTDRLLERFRAAHRPLDDAAPSPGEFDGDSDAEIPAGGSE